MIGWYYRVSASCLTFQQLYVRQKRASCIYCAFAYSGVVNAAATSDSEKNRVVNQ